MGDGGIGSVLSTGLAVSLAVYPDTDILLPFAPLTVPLAIRIPPMRARPFLP